MSEKVSMASWTKLMFLWKSKTFKATRNAKEKTVHGFTLAQQSQFFLAPLLLLCIPEAVSLYNHEFYAV